MEIRFLKDTTCPVKIEIRCGDGCCSWWENDGNDFFKGGDEAWEPTIDISNLEEGIDFEYID